MAGGGGGAWKVAYADFVTAMMALFLVLWIISQDEQIKGNVQQYFRTRFASVTKQSVGIIPIENADLIRAKRAHFEKASAIPLEQVRRLNDDLVRAFVQNPEYIDMKTFSYRCTRGSAQTPGPNHHSVDALAPRGWLRLSQSARAWLG